MSNYKKANGDNRDVIERYLPTAYKTESSANSGTYKGVLHALKSIVKTTENELLENTKSMFLSSAKGPFLDLYGAWVGVKRNTSEADDDYRKRVIKEITRGRATISNIIVGVKDELGDSVGVSIYETWRNIFILNQSLLNGPDYLMGKYYRYAVIEVTLDKYVPQAALVKLIDKYKSAGVMVLFTYSDSIVAVDDTLLALNTSLAEYLSLATEIPTTDIYSLSKRFGLNSLPIQDKDLNYPLFKTNKSNLNGTDKLSGSPRQLFSESYVGVPSLNIMGLVDKDTDPRNYNNPYEYIYENSKVLKGGRNLLLNTSNPITASGVNYANGNFDDAGGKWTLSGGLNVAGLVKQYGSDKTLTLSFDWSASGDNISGTFNPQWDSTPWGDSLTDYTVKVTSTNTSGHIVANVPLGKDSYANGQSKAMHFRQDNLQCNITISNMKLEVGTVPTAWSPAPEDNNPETYKHPYKIEDYYTVSNRPFSFGNSTASYPNFVFDISDAVIGYAKYTFDGDDFLKQFDSIDLKIGPSPYGLRSSKVIINNDDSLGSWDTTLSNGDYIVDITNSTGRYNYKLSSPTNIKTFSLKDYYPSEGSYRSIYLNKKGSNPLLLARTKSQTFSDIFINDYIINRYQYLLPYIRKVTVAGTSMLNPEVYNSTTGSWDKIPSDDTDLSSYLKASGDNPIYLLIRDNSENSTVANLGVSIEFEQQQRVVQYEIDSTPVDANEYSINKNIGYTVDKDSPTDAYNHNVE